MAGQINAFEMAQKQFDGVAKQLRLDPGVAEVLRWPMREFSFRIPVRFSGKSGLILLDQIRTLDQLRLVKRLGAVGSRTLSATLSTLQEVFAA